jgi:hypothetical protein
MARGCRRGNWFTSGLHVKIHNSLVAFRPMAKWLMRRWQPELMAIVDEAHRRNMWSPAIPSGDELAAIVKGIDNIQHATAATDEDIPKHRRANLPYHHHPRSSSG